MAKTAGKTDDNEAAGIDSEMRDELSRFGRRLHHLRAARGWSLSALATRSNLSKSFLSRLESGDRPPSIAAVLTLARVFNVAMGALFESALAEAQNCAVIRGAAAIPHQGNGLTYVALSSPALPSSLQPIRLTIHADRKGDERYEHDGEEWIYVLSGKVRLAVGDQEHVLGKGDAAHFESRHPHRLWALGGKDAEIIVVACAPAVPSAHDADRAARL